MLQASALAGSHWKLETWGNQCKHSSICIGVALSLHFSISLCICKQPTHLSSESSSSSVANSSASARLKPACVVEKPHL